MHGILIGITIGDMYMSTIDPIPSNFVGWEEQFVLLQVHVEKRTVPKANQILGRDRLNSSICNIYMSIIELNQVMPSHDPCTAYTHDSICMLDLMVKFERRGDCKDAERPFSMYK